MSRSRIVINIGSIRLCIDHISLRTQRIKHRFGNVPGASVGTVQTNLHPFERIHTQRNQIADVTVSSGNIIHCTANLLFMCIRNFLIMSAKHFQLPIQIVLDQTDGFLIHFLTITVDQLNTIIIVWIMTCRNHDTTIKFIYSRHICHGWSCSYMKQICICTGSYQPTYQSIFKHIAGAACILTNYNAGRSLLPGLTLQFPVIPSQETSDLICMIRCQILIRFATEAICTEIFSHFHLSFLFLYNSNNLFPTKVPSIHPRLL